MNWTEIVRAYPPGFFEAEAEYIGLADKETPPEVTRWDLDRVERNSNIQIAILRNQLNALKPKPYKLSQEIQDSQEVQDIQYSQEIQEIKDFQNIQKSQEGE